MVNLRLTILLILLLPASVWGEDKTIDLSLSENSGGFTIEDNGTYIFTGTYPQNAVPNQTIDKSRKAVINVASGKEAIIILDNVNISLNEKNQCPLSARDAQKVIVQLRGKNTLSTINSQGECPGLWAPQEGDDCELIIQNGEADGSLGSLIAQGAKFWPGIGVSQGKKGKITINGGYITAKGGPVGAAGIGSSLGNGGYKGIITINDGDIIAIGGEDEESGNGGAGIGGGAEGNGGSIIINGGTVYAKGEDGGAGIGGGCDGTGGTITIKGATITAIGGYNGAGIGGGNNASCGIITINGGIIKATGGENGAGIGNGDWGNYGTITINGGTVNAKEGENSVGIGGGDQNPDFSTGIAGNAFINASSIKAQTKENSWQGIIFKGNTGLVYGSPTLSTDAIIPEDKTLTIESNKTLTVASNVTLVNKGTISNNPNGMITNNGTIMLIDNGNIQGTLPNNPAVNGFSVTCDLNYTDAPNDDIIYIKKGESMAYTPAFSPKYSTFDGWYADSDATTNKLSTITQTTTAYAHWKPKDFTVKSGIAFDAIYGTEFTHTFNADELSENIKSNAGGLISIKPTDTKSLPNGLILKDLTISGKPTSVNEDGNNVTFQITAKNGAQQEVTINFKVNKVKLTVTPVQNQSIYIEEADTYEPTFNVSDAANNEVPKYKGKLAWDDNNNTFTIGSLALLNNGSFMQNNYELELSSSPVTIEIKNEAIPIEQTGTAGENEWRTSDITLTPSTDFKIRGNSKLRSTWLSSLTISEEGNYTYSYSLLRDGQTNPIEKTIPVKLDKTPPTLVASTSDLSYTLTFGDGDKGSGIKKLSIDNNEITLPTDATSYSGTSSEGDHTAKIIDNAGLTTIVSFRLSVKTVDPEPVPVPTPDPTPDPAPEPVNYLVTLPSIEGVITDPVAGKHQVESGRSFKFYLTLADGYQKDSNPIVTTDRGETIEPRASDGAYIINSVDQNVIVLISGIVADHPTSNEEINNTTIIRVVDGSLSISVPQAVIAGIFDLSGRVIQTLQLAPGETRVDGLRKGPYVVKLEGQRGCKILIK